MTIQDVIDKILAYHPAIDNPQTCDGVKCGDPSQPVTAVAVSCAPTYEVVGQAAALGCNLLVCHEPTFYSHADTTGWLEEDPVYREKMRVINESGLVIFRDHDHLHAHDPDGIYFGVMKELGWEPYRADSGRRPMFYTLPETTVGALAAFLKEKLEMCSVRVIGKPDGKVTKAAYIGGGNLSFDDANTKMMMGETEVMIAGELIDWTVMSYVRDAAAMGMQKTILQLGHFNSEELGMKYAACWLPPLIPGVKVHWIRAGEPYRYL